MVDDDRNRSPAISFIHKAKISEGLPIQEREKGRGWLEFIERLAAR